MPVVAFVVGVGAGALLAEALVRRGVRSSIAPGLAIGAALVGAFLLWRGSTPHQGTVPLEPRWALDLQAAILAFAMGVQTATFRRVDGVTVRTTFVTGMVTQLAEELAARFAGRHDAPAGRGFARRVATLASIWPCFLTGAVAGAFGHTRWGTGALLVPIGILVALAGYDSPRGRRAHRAAPRTDAAAPRGTRGE